MTAEKLSEHEGRVTRLEAQVDLLQRDISEMKADLKAIRSKTDRWSGVVAVGFILLPATVAAFLTWLVSSK